jgi:hypothetical protein
MRKLSAVEKTQRIRENSKQPKLSAAEKTQCSRNSAQQRKLSAAETQRSRENSVQPRNLSAAGEILQRGVPGILDLWRGHRISTIGAKFESSFRLWALT